MHKKKNFQLLVINYSEYITHRQSWPIIIGNKKSYFVYSLAFTEKYDKYYLMSQKKCHTIRPLLRLKRLETGKMCRFWQLPIYPDLSNQKLKFLRNRLRKQLLPTLKLFFNPQIENVLLQFAEIADIENYYINQTTTQLIRTFVKPKVPLGKWLLSTSSYVEPKAYGVASEAAKGVEHQLFTFEKEQFFSFIPLCAFPKITQIQQKASALANWKILQTHHKKKEQNFVVDKVAREAGLTFASPKDSTKSCRPEVAREAAEGVEKSRNEGVRAEGFIPTGYRSRNQRACKGETKSIEKPIFNYRICNLRQKHFCTPNSNCSKLPTLLRTFALFPCRTYKKGWCFNKSFLNLQGIYQKNNAASSFTFSGSTKKFGLIEPKAYGVETKVAKKIDWIQNLQKKKNRNWFNTIKTVDNKILFLVPLCMKKNNVSQHFFISRNDKIAIPRKDITTDPFYDKEVRFDSFDFDFVDKKSKEKNNFANIDSQGVPYVLPRRGIKVETERVKKAEAVETKSQVIKLLDKKKKYTQIRRIYEILLKKGIFSSSFEPKAGRLCRTPRNKGVDLTSLFTGVNNNVSSFFDFLSTKSKSKESDLTFFSSTHQSFQVQGTRKCNNFIVFPLIKKNWSFKLKNRQTVCLNIDKFNPSNLFFRFSTPIRTTSWVWTRKLNTNSRWNNSLKTEIECALLSMSIPTLSHSAFRLNTFCFPEGAFFTPSAASLAVDSVEKKSTRESKEAGRQGRKKRFKKNPLKLFTSKNFVSDFTVPQKSKTSKSSILGDFFNKKMNHIFVTNFFIYFDTLEMEKKEIYWPIIISFFPLILQRRVVKLFLTTRNWKDVRYSHIENFLEKKNIYTPTYH